eukprot:TRINITY_DN35796_c0_g1_i1.p1 TRINITY_DN35796_c0_g1~~TRINITY_DN35796_c0_g1_i1.p1  ORF type:complete len:377 (+),score=143.20 TRINITY_DN35796_c0_g1_i1:88-1131(+)
MPKRKGEDASVSQSDDEPQQKAVKRGAKKASAKKAAKKAPAKAAAKPSPGEGATPVDELMVGPSHEGSELVGAYTGNDVKSTQYNIISWNVNGIRALIKKAAQLEELAKRERPHVVCLQETKIDCGEVGKLGTLMAGYTVHWNCCKVKKGYSGTAMFVRDDVAGEIDVSIEGLGEDFNDEGRYQIATIGDFILINTYVPNAGQKLDRLDYRTETWDIALRNFMKKKRDEGVHVVWTGDLNVAHTEIDLKNPKTNKKSAGFTQEERDSFTETLGSGFVDTFRHFHPDKQFFYSYWGYRFNSREKNTGWRLDYFVVNEAFLPRIAASSILPYYEGSDHCPVQCLVEKQK